MDSAPAGPEPTQEEHVRSFEARRAVAALPVWLRVTVAAYVVVALFGLAYLIVATLSDLSASATATVAALIAAPLAVGLLWQRLTGFAAFGFEVTLAEVTVQLDTKLAAAVTSPDLGSANQDLVKQMEAITEPEVELLEVDLRDGSYWWSTRMYLLAALAHDVSEIRAFILLANEHDRRFIGTVTPLIVRRALAAQTPELEATYHNVSQAAPVDDARARVSQIVYSWTAQNFGPNKSIPEREFASRISPDSMQSAVAAIGRWLNTDSMDWPGYATPQIVRALVRDFDGEYVALLRNGSFDRVISRGALASEIAAGQA